MYIATWNEDDYQWEVFDPDGDFVCYVDTFNKDVLLSHLNRGQ